MLAVGPWGSEEASTALQDYDGQSKQVFGLPETLGLYRMRDAHGCPSNTKASDPSICRNLRANVLQNSQMTLIADTCAKGALFSQKSRVGTPVLQ